MKYPADNGKHETVSDTKANIDTGYRLVYRSMANHPLVGFEKPYSKSEAWLDMLWSACGAANGMTKEITIKNSKFSTHIEYSQFICSQVYLGEKWGWSRQKVRSFFQALRAQKMIEIDQFRATSVTTSVATSVLTKVTICNFYTYQQRATNVTTSVATSVATTNEHVLGTRKEKDSCPKSPTSHDTWQYKYAKRFYELIPEYHNLTSIRKTVKADFKTWVDAIDKLNRIDGIDKDRIAKVLKFAREDDFWRSNLQSLAALRNKNKNGLMKFEQIEIKMNHPVANGKPKEEELIDETYNILGGR